MDKEYVVFEIKLKKINFKAPNVQSRDISFNLFHNNKKIDGTETIQVQQNQKETVIDRLKTLVFDSKNETSKFPILIQIVHGDEKPKRIILRRSQILKNFEKYNKYEFFFDQDLGNFSIYYQVNVFKRQNLQKKQKETTPIKDSKTTAQKPKQQLRQSAKLQQITSSRNIKRPSMLAVGQAAARIRKSSMQVKQNLKKTESKTYIKHSQSNSEQKNPFMPSLTLTKQEEQQKQLVKKELKLSLFSNFQETEKPKYQSGIKNSNHSHRKENHDTHKTHTGQNLHVSHANGKDHSEHGKSHHGNQNHEHNDHGDGHDDHGDGEQNHLSLKLKIVILMLIVGFLFLMYDALDDRFSRNITRNQHDQSEDHHHAHGKGSHSQNKNKNKKGKKQKKQPHH